jgi:murein L,D-transpeptidase YcbB/YkuD
MRFYFMYISVQKTDSGAIRFVDDEYGQDLRLAKALLNRHANGELF